MKFKVRFMMVASNAHPSPSPLSKVVEDTNGVWKNFGHMVPIFPKVNWLSLLGSEPKDIEWDEKDDANLLAQVVKLLPNGWGAVVVSRHHCCGSSGCQECAKGIVLKVTNGDGDETWEGSSSDGAKHRLTHSLMVALVPA